MYRLHNPGIESKIDWLVKNRDLKSKQVVIVLFNDLGIKIKNYLNSKYDIREVAIIDDDVAKFIGEVKSMEYIRNLVKKYSNLAYITADDSEDRINKICLKLSKYGAKDEDIYILRGRPLRAQDALLKCCEDSSINTVLDVGYGFGLQSNIFKAYGKDVTGIDFGAAEKPFKTLSGDFETYEFKDKYDLVWSSHSLEHQQNIRVFIQKLFSVCKPSGKVAITVPHTRGDIYVIGGHVTVWNLGLLMYNIICAGYSCVNAIGKTYAGNVSVIAPNEPIEFDGDYRWVNHKEYFPSNLDVGDNGFGNVAFNGEVESINWD
ncbi:MAG: class I SAM-dependent methyltransferase [Selenomonadaceae bacterium]|nr:class I SAM-dependent methyltransferase [Selenomonadaceae bacterium]